MHIRWSHQYATRWQVHPKILSSLKTLDTGWTVQESNPCRGRILCTCPDRPWGPPSLLYRGYWVSILGVKWLGCGTDHPPTPTTVVKKWAELYLYSPSGPSWAVLGWNLPLPLPLKTYRISTNDIMPLMHDIELSLQLGEPCSYITCNNKWNCYARCKCLLILLAQWCVMDITTGDSFLGLCDHDFI